MIDWSSTKVQMHTYFRTSVNFDMKGAEDTSVELVLLLHILNFKEAIVL